MKTLLPTKLLLASGLALGCSACLTVDPFVEPAQQCNPTAAALPAGSALSAQAQQQIQAAFDRTYFDALVAVRGQTVLVQRGETRLPMNCASARKSIFSLLYGIAESRGLVNLDATLEQLGIDDRRNPLTPAEKQATLRQLLQARSGVYIPALGETQEMKRKRPARGQYRPGEYFYYNNWDFNTLPIYLERVTGKSVGQLIYEWLAVPTGMRDFCPENVKYEYADYTEYPQTRVYMSAEDLARLGAMLLQGGVFDGQRVVPEQWIALSTQPVSKRGVDQNMSLDGQFYDGYAYLWWTHSPSQTFWADGSGGQFLIVDRRRNLAVVVRNNTGTSNAGVLLYNATNRYQDSRSGYALYQLIENAL